MTTVTNPVSTVPSPGATQGQRDQTATPVAESPNEARAQGASLVPLPPHAELAQSAFLSAYRTALVDAVAQSAPPLYQGPSVVPTARLGLLKRKPLGAQALAVLAGACGIRGRRLSRADIGLRRTPGLGLVMEMGCGKTFCALAILAMADEEVTRISAPPDQRAEKSSFFPAVVLCPPILQEKWAREAEQTLPNARVVILRPITTRAEADAFRCFDPTFRGKQLSAIGVADRIAARIRAELALWQAACVRARAAGKRPPAKPCHVVVISQSTAKFGMPWTPIYTLRVLREVGEDGLVRIQRKPESGEPLVVPCCPSCFSPIGEDERHARARERRAKKGKQTQRNTSAADSADVVEGDEDLDGIVAAWDLPYLEEADLLGIDCPRMKRTCAVCGEALWQSVPSSSDFPARLLPDPPLEGVTRAISPLPLPRPGFRPPNLVTSTAQRRYPIADYLRRRHRGLFRTLIADEAHQLKGAGTAQGFAAASLLDACGPDGTAVFLTGTLFSGYASDMFPMLWRLMPSLREFFGYEEAARWVRLYGVRQKLVKIDVTPGAGARGGARSKRSEEVPRFRELPGISPLVLNLLLPHCLFLELADVAPDLPPYREEIVTVPMGDELGKLYAEFERESTASLRAQLIVGDNSGTSSWFHSLMIWPNLPSVAIEARSKRTGVVLGSAPALPADTAYPKERALLDLVRRERAEGRRCLIYVEHTGEHDLLPRLVQLLQEDDTRWRAEDPDDHPGVPIRVMVLRGETVASAKREEWLAKQVELGCDVLLCHSGLVEVGLDLLAFPTILVYEVIFSTTRWRQAIRRSWRPGQTRDVRVIQLAYERTMEARGLQLIATKAISSLMIEGKMPSATLTAQAQTNATTNLIMELFEQVTAEAEEGGAAGSIAQSVKATFLELGRVEQEADSFIGVVEGSLAEDEPNVALDEDGSDAEDYGLPWSVSSVSSAPRVTVSSRVDNGDAEPTPLFSELAPGSPGSSATDGARSVGTPPVVVVKVAATPDQSDTLGDGRMDMQIHRYTWEEMRARLEQEATERKRGRARRSRSTAAQGGATDPELAASLWDAPPTRALDVAADDTAPVDRPNDAEAATNPGGSSNSSEEQPTQTADTSGPVGQLSLFG